MEWNEFEVLQHYANKPMSASGTSRDCLWTVCLRTDTGKKKGKKEERAETKEEGKKSLRKKLQKQGTNLSGECCDVLWLLDEFGTGENGDDGGIGSSFSDHVRPDADVTTSI